MTKAVDKIANQIKAARKRQRLTQTELGDMLGVTKGTIASYEAGRNNFTTETLSKLATVLGITFAIEPDNE